MATQPSQPATTPPPQHRAKHQIYSRPLPLHTHPLPAFLPHNPISIFRIAWALLSELVYPPSSHDVTSSKHSNSSSEALFSHDARSSIFSRNRRRTPYIAYLDPHTNTVQVTDPEAIRALWEQGFFGKGSLSRSEPEWLRRVESARNKTAGQVTDKRRKERRDMKMKRAKEELEELERVRREEMGLENAEVVEEDEAETGDTEELDKLVDELNGGEEAARHAMNGSANGHVIKPGDTQDQNEPRDVVSTSAASTVNDIHHLDTTNTHVPSSSFPLENQEHLQLTPPETLYLTYALGILTVLSPSTNKPLTIPTLLTTFARTATFPPSPTPPYPTPITDLPPDNPFLLSYITYHHYRSLGWTVRPGLKFSVDHLLYARGPPFSHAQFAVVVLPAYTHPYWTAGEGCRTKSEAEARRRHVKEREGRDWWWFHNVSRVQAQVLKSLVLCWVEVPPPVAHESRASGEELDGVVSKGWRGEDVGALLRRYRVREVVCRRWTPQRNLK